MNKIITMKKIILSIIALCLAAMTNAQVIEKTYQFDNYKVEAIGQYERITFDDCMQSALTGQPDLPWQGVSLMLPPHTQAASIMVEFDNFVEIEGSHTLYPHQSAKAYSDMTRHAFEKDMNIYQSSEVYPQNAVGKVTTQYLNGVGIAFASFCPVKYIPSTGKTMIAKTAKVTLKAEPTKRKDTRNVWLTPANRMTMNRLVQNPEMATRYETDVVTLPDYDLLIITTPTYDPEVVGDADQTSFAQYIYFYELRGIRVHCVNTETIYQNMEGRDLAEKIRNYIIQEYDEKGISMVLLGGDTDLVPYRGFYGNVLSGGSYMTDENIPADLYYAGLDGTWNDNNNELWGEEGEDDLLPEVGIGRMCFNNLTEFANIMHKTFSYQDNPVLGEFHKVTFGGEFLYDDPYSLGSDYLELLIGEHSDNGYTTVGIPENYDFTRLYHETDSWSASNLAQAINEGTQYVFHQGHANTNYVAGFVNEDITNENFPYANGVDHNYTFMHTSGCICGDFSSNCILERMTQIENFAVATIGNSRYGWFNEGQTEGPACHLMRETVDAFYNDRIPYLGMAVRESKIQTAPWVTAPGQWEEGALRWNFYCLNVLGDVAVAPWNDEPFTPQINIGELGLMPNSESVSLNVCDAQCAGLFNFTCNIFREGTLIGRNTTDSSGNATIELVSPLQTNDTITLIVTGENAWYQTLEYVIGEDGIRENTQYAKVYPNPANDILNIDTDEECDITIYNSVGQAVHSQLIQGKTVINVNYLATGIYYIGVKSSSNNDFIKFIKK